jgi:hypothetical protein
LAVIARGVIRRKEHGWQAAVRGMPDRRQRAGLRAAVVEAGGVGVAVCGRGLHRGGSCC